MKVEDDRELMNMFDLNNNSNDPIDLYVDGQILVYVPNNYNVASSSNERVERFVISSDGEGNQPDRVHSQGLFDVQVDCEDRLADK